MNDSFFLLSGFASAMKRSLSLALCALGFACSGVSVIAADFNAEVLAQIRRMPTGGDYAVSAEAFMRLRGAVTVENQRLSVQAELARPSFCSGATYLVLLRTLDALRTKGTLVLPPEVLSSLLIKGQPDGTGVWGRWNANGPGTARLFYELALGRNFERYEEARAGDFMKIFWTSEIGKLERGHSVVYLGQETVNGEPHVRFWSSNKPGGYGEKSVPRSSIAYALFSRLEQPENITKVSDLPKSDAFLADMLTKRFSVSEVRIKTGVR